MRINSEGSLSTNNFFLQLTPVKKSSEVENLLFLTGPTFFYKSEKEAQIGYFFIIY